MAIGPLCARFRDLPQIVANGVQVMFFLSPVIWSADQLPQRAIFIEANPFYHLVEVVRAPLLGEFATATNWQVVTSVIAVLVVASAISAAVTRKRVFLWL
jgi:ABC-type polysaccharide/polyol phosphate export permease